MSSTKRNREILENDFYETPRWCVENFLDNTRIDLEYASKEILEPCCGNGAISKVLEEYFKKDILTIDIRENSNAMVKTDYLTYKLKAYKPTWIITNPPFFLAMDVITKALQDTSDYVTMLLRLNFLESQARFNFWQLFPAFEVLVLHKRPSFKVIGNSRTDSTAYAWFTWQKGFDGVTYLKVI